MITVYKKLSVVMDRDVDLHFLVAYKIRDGILYIINQSGETISVYAPGTWKHVNILPEIVEGEQDAVSSGCG